MAHSRTDPANHEFPSPLHLAQRLLDEFTTRALRSQTVVVAIDGRSGSGKSTLAAAFADALRDQKGSKAVVIDGDDFYGGRSAENWDGHTPAENAKLAFDWHRQRNVLEALRIIGAAQWFPFDWAAHDWDSDEPPLSRDPASCSAAAVVVLEGVYSARPELHDLLDIRILLRTPADQRRRQLIGREGDEYRNDWEVRWSAAEDHYFQETMPPKHFDVVLE